MAWMPTRIWIQMKNNTKFLDTFENIEVYVRRINDYSREPLSRLVNTTNDAIIRDQRRNLEVLMTIRNALVHNGVDNYVEVTSELLEMAMEVYNALPIHKKASDYMSRNVVSFDIDESIEKPLSTIRHTKMVRFPIYENGNVVGILSDNGISHWLAENIEHDVISIKSTTIRDVALHDEYFYDVHYVGRDATYSQVFGMFERALGLRMVLVSESGKPHQKVLGVITRGDILK